ncbi:hypothetical protein [Paratissierella segnis]|uniref:Uncharacterized protein n=1 Tax=Paratissierella segnis TaxID=2763679 RepID=A0A926EV43_9FIRM|nr:hypothetical protein [Paratissierella segnis]MBC8588077.1 hypothetical protein [Paratissierella segnis]
MKANTQKNTVYKTSHCLLMILKIEEEIETSRILNYYKELVKLGYVEINGTKLKLTEKGKSKFKGEE